MVKTFSQVAGVVQTLMGLAGQFAPAAGAALGGTQTGGNTFNILSGLALSYLGFQGSQNAQRTGAQTVGTVNAIVGVLGVLGITHLGPIELNPGLVANIVNLAIGAWGLYAGFAKKS